MSHAFNGFMCALAMLLVPVHAYQAATATSVASALAHVVLAVFCAVMARKSWVLTRDS